MRTKYWWAVAIILFLVAMSCVILVASDPNWWPLLVPAAGSFYCLIVGFWHTRTPLVPLSVCDLRDPISIIRARRELARTRPWMWGRLARLWTYVLLPLDDNYAAGPVYRWKTRDDRRVEKRMRQCCGWKPGRRCEAHGSDYV